MRLIWTTLLLPLAVSCAAVKNRRQITPELLEGLITADGLRPLLPNFFGILDPEPVKSDKSTDMPPQIRKTATRKLVRWGPFEVLGVPKPNEEREWIPGHVESMDPMGTVITATLTDGFCQDCTILAGRTDLTLEDGSPADISNGVYLHHVLTFDRSKSPPSFVNFCPDMVLDGGIFTPDLMGLNPLGMLFLGGGNDGSNVRYSTSDSRIQSGYYIKNNTFAMTLDVVNYTDEKKDIYVTFDVEYLPGKIGTDAASTLLSVTGCLGQGFMDEVPESILRSENFKIREDGWILSARGHLHDGGEAMELSLNGKVVCSSTATYGGKGGTVMINGTEWKTISSMSECHEPFRVKKGDNISMRSFYNTTKHPLRESDGFKMEEMGLFALAFAPLS